MLAGRNGLIDEILLQGTGIAREEARKTLEMMKEAMGLDLLERSFQRPSRQ